MKYFFRLLLGFLFLSIIFVGVNFAAAEGEVLEVRIHKNSLQGDEYNSPSDPIAVNIIDDLGIGLGIGVRGGEYPAGSGQFLLDPTKGPLEIVEEKNCIFSWADNSGNPITKVASIREYAQGSSGVFASPPLRIQEERISTDKAQIQNCKGGEIEYEALKNEIENLPDNPFRIYREYVSLPIDPDLLGKEISISILANPDENTIQSMGENPINGFLCALSTTDENTEEKRGLCTQKIILDPSRAENGVFRVDLVILADSSASIVRNNIEETLIQGINSEFSNSVTFVGNFLIRSISLLDWTLAIDDTGFRNEKITSVYKKSLNIVNGFFILALLSIAFLWNFSVLVSRDRLKKIMILFIVGIMSVNFMLPVTRLLVDGTNILQRSLLTKENTDLSSQRQISSSDLLSVQDLDIGGFIGLQKSSYIDKNYPEEIGEQVDTDKLSQKSDLYIDRFQENTWFTLGLVFLGALGQFLITLVLLFRYVILWFLLIFSPFLLVLALFSTTRFLFRYWIWLYARWLLIGPILALTLFVVVNIWSLTGVPLESSYAAPSSLIFPNTTNLYVAAPGITSGYLNTPREITKYIGALMMLYMAIILPFWLTRYIPGTAESKLKSKLFGKRSEKRSSELLSDQKNKKSEGAFSGNSVLGLPGNITSLLSEQTSQPSSESSQVQSSSHKQSSTKTGNKGPQSVDTKDLLNTLTILNASNGLQNTSAAEKSRSEDQKGALLKEIGVRAKSGDTTALNALKKIEAESIQQNATGDIRISDDKKKTPQHKSTVEQAKSSEHISIEEQRKKDDRNPTQRAFGDMDKEKLLKAEQEKQNTQENIRKKRHEKAKDKLLQKSTIAHEAEEFIKNKTLNDIQEEHIVRIHEENQNLKTMNTKEIEENISSHIENNVTRNTTENTIETDIDTDVQTHSSSPTNIPPSTPEPLETDDDEGKGK